MSTLDRVISDGLTGRALLEMLQQMSDEELNRPVAFTYTANDYWHTELAAIADGVETGVIKYSDYHNCPKLVEDDKVQEAIDEINDNLEEGEDPIEDDNLPEGMAHAILITVVNAY